jgi:YD repeat-containing protein
VLSTTSSATYDMQVLSTTDAKNYVNSYTYDAQGALWQEFHADNDTTVASVTYANDAFGQHTTVTQNVSSSATGAVVTTYTFDRLGHQKTRTVGATTGANALNVSSYDGVSTETKSVGAITETYGYDELGRRITDTLTTNAANIAGGPTLATRYDLSGNIVSTVDGNSLVTSTAYDALNHKTDMVLATGEYEHWDGDAFGRVNSYTDIAGNITRYDYNASGQLLHQYRVVDKSGLGLQNLQYTYENGTGRLLKIDDNALNQHTVNLH